MQAQALKRCLFNNAGPRWGLWTGLVRLKALAAGRHVYPQLWVGGQWLSLLERYLYAQIIRGFRGNIHFFL